MKQTLMPLSIALENFVVLCSTYLIHHYKVGVFLSTYGIFVDLSKALETVDHTILLKQLEINGITGASLAWFRSYRTNRKQHLCINNDTKTNEQKVTCRPLLFLI